MRLQSLSGIVAVKKGEGQLGRFSFRGWEAKAGARLRHVAGIQWGSKKYMSMKHLETTILIGRTGISPTNHQLANCGE